MRIEDPGVLTTFGEIEEGEVFRHVGDYYTKVKPLSRSEPHQSNVLANAISISRNTTRTTNHFTDSTTIRHYPDAVLILARRPENA